MEGDGDLPYPAPPSPTRFLLIKLLKALTKATRIPPSCFFVSYFTVSVIPSINTPESSNDFIILIRSFTSSFALSVPFPLIFLSNFYIAFEVKLLTSPCKLSIA